MACDVSLDVLSDHAKRENKSAVFALMNCVTQPTELVTYLGTLTYSAINRNTKIQIMCNP